VLETVTLTDVVGADDSWTVIAPDAPPAARFSVVGTKLSEPAVATAVEKALTP
jgi:hypothetical protein